MASAVIGALRVNLGMDSAQFHSGVDAAGRGLDKLGERSRRAGRQMDAMRAQTGNLAAQFQDIGVQLAGGTSPFLIAMQQGTQINQVLGGQGVRGAVTALGGAFASLVNPVSLATIAIITAGGAAVQYFSRLADDGEKSAEQLKEQASLIKSVADEWGDAVPALREYSAELQRLASIESLREASTAAVADIWSEPQQQVREYATDVERIVMVLQSIGDTDGVNRLRDAFETLQDRVEDQTATAEDARRVQDALNTMLVTGGPIAERLAGSMDALAGSLESAANSAARVTSEVAGALNSMRRFREADAESMRNLEQAQRTTERMVSEQERLNVLSREELALENEKRRIKEDIRREGGVVSDDTALRLAEQTLAAEQRRAEAAKEARSGGSAGKSAQRERDAVVDLIEALEFERSLIGATDLERERANALRRAGAAATDAQRARIEELVAATYAETEALRTNEEAMERIKDLGQDVLGGLVDDLRRGTGAAQALANALGRVAESMAQAALEQFGNAMFGGGKVENGLLGGLMGGLRGLLPGFANGGSMRVGGAGGIDSQLVAFRATPGETVDIRKPGQDMGGGINVHVTASELFDVMVRREADASVERASPRIVGAAVSRANAQVVPTMARYQRDSAGSDYRG